MAELSEQLREMLSDPASLEKIAAIAGSLGLGNQNPAPEASFAPPSGPSVPARPVARKKDPRTELLQALRPFVAPEKQGQLDDILRLMTLAEFILPLLGKGKGDGRIV